VDEIKSQAVRTDILFLSWSTASIDKLGVDVNVDRSVMIIPEALQLLTLLNDLNLVTQ
jgi:hypothetical protein